MTTTPTARHSAPAGRRRTPRAVLVGAGLAAVLIGVTIGIVVLTRSGDDATAPYRDPNATGRIGLCDARSKAVTSGSVSAKPFVWRAVGTTPASGNYAGAGQTATLYVHQPRAGATSTEWSGRELTAPAKYSNSAHPMAQATKLDSSLADFLSGYPAMDKGFVQLRLVLSAPGQPADTGRYDALDIKVSGDTWRAVDAPQVNCGAGTAVSLETAVGTDS